MRNYKEITDINILREENEFQLYLWAIGHDEAMGESIMIEARIAELEAERKEVR